MQTYDADFFPIGQGQENGNEEAQPEKNGRSKKHFVIAAALLCAMLLALLAFRVFSWTGRQQETTLLALVNPWNPVEFCGFTPKLTEIGGGLRADTRCAEALEQMLADCEAAGNKPYVSAAYREKDEQQSLFDERVQRLRGEGLSVEAAEERAAAELGRPGYCEHETGLALDIVDGDYRELDGAQADTPTQQWLAANCRRYGFIQRYPQGAESVTGMDAAPWHYRYVGVEAAEQIGQLGISLEEYVTMFYSEEAVIVFE